MGSALTHQPQWGPLCSPAPWAAEMPWTGGCRELGWASLPQSSLRGAATEAQGPALSTNLLLKPKRDFGALQYKLINFYVQINGSY